MEEKIFERVISLIGNHNYNKIKTKTILLVGLGGVGGYALESLVRSGIKNFILIDYDVISQTNLNRQIISNQENIGNFKTHVAKERIKSINPDTTVITQNIHLDKSNINILDKYHIDYIIDACDTVETKKLLIDYSIKNNIKIISSMGTANKLDPTKLTITDIRKTSYDPLAKIIRKYVQVLKTNKKIMVVSSTESPIKKKELSTMIFVPATSGILLANYVIKDIIASD